MIVGNMSNREIVFVANHEPPLKDGLYSLGLTHNLQYGSETQTFVKNHSFAVAGERFSLNDNVIYKLFPPAKSQGHFDNVLPHVVFSRRTLPWERAPDASAEDSSWLAILVFTQSAAPAPVSGKLSNLYPASAPDGGGLLPAGTYSYGSGLASGEYFLGYGESADDGCIYMDIPAAQFATFAPSLADLAWNAHARTLTASGSEAAKDYATVVANRQPIPGTTCIAHLVSFEGLGSQLPEDDGTYAVAPTWTSIRLVSLKSWSFYVSPLEASFAHILQGLNGGINQSETELGDSQIRLPSGYIPAAATGLAPPSLPFDSGYSVLAGSDGAAGKTAWYRGPFTPSTITPAAADASWTSNPLPANAAAALVASVSTTPANNASFAAAWQLGRLLALADRSFATAQVSWKRDIRLALNTKLGQANKLVGGSRADYAKKMRTVIADATQITAQLGATLTVAPADNKLSIPQNLVDWLGRLALLSNVPVEYLIPDMHMLPPESLRFFNIDPRWLACLLDGAWSLDRQPAEQWAFDTAYQPWQQILDGSLKTSFAPLVTCWPVSGMILNSQLIPAYWPGIEFLPTPSANILCEEDLGPSTLLMLLDQELTDFEIRQPPESIHFGFDMDSTGVMSKPLRYVQIDGTLYPAPPGGAGLTPSSGSPAPASDGLTSIPQRIPKVIQFDKLATAMAIQLGVTDISTFSAAEFALELVESVAAVEFELPSGG